MKIYLKNTVYEETLKRIEYFFNEFSDVLVAFSGGKDSTVVLNLTLEVARKLNRLPVNVLFIDQEAEWQHTIEYVRRVQQLPDINLLWFQGEFLLSNSAQNKDIFFTCWDKTKEQEWVRPKEEKSIKENIYGVTRFYDLFDGILKKEFPNKACILGGVNASESFRRFLATTANKIYKWITYGKKVDDTHYIFYPIYDWEVSDVWKYIFDNNLDFNKVYNLMYAYGTAPRNMRVSSLCHEVALPSILQCQEFEPDNWERIQGRLEGFNSYKQIGKQIGKQIEVPYMFTGWEEYFNYLLNHLCTQEVSKRIRRKVYGLIKLFPKSRIPLLKVGVRCVIANDFETIFLDNLYRNLDVERKRQNGN
jgi:predicted phosphoadenosine phosphosulfate sulfurtransferase